MQYLFQFLVIAGVSFAGEGLHALIPLPIPASIYGLGLMFLGLVTGLIPYRAVKDTAHFLIGIMPVMFLPAAVGLLTSMDVLRPLLLPFGVTMAVSTFAVMLASGRVTQALRRASRKEEK